MDPGVQTPADGAAINCCGQQCWCNSAHFCKCVTAAAGSSDDRVPHANSSTAADSNAGISLLRAAEVWAGGERAQTQPGSQLEPTPERWRFLA
eukprot:3799550-Alexandrium_andersonii.AAC.1